MFGIIDKKRLLSFINSGSYAGETHPRDERGCCLLLPFVIMSIDIVTYYAMILTSSADIVQKD